MYQKKHIKNNAFTLVEMAIVVMIIGLLVGAVVIGRTITTNARLQSLIADIDSFKKASQLFKDKYGELPGDYSAATTHWGAEAACPVGATTPHTTTCNGNGDGFIGSTSNTLITLATTNDAHRETLRAWQQLANAGFIPGSYSGYQSSAGLVDESTNAPKSAVKDATYLMFYVPRVATTTTFSYASDYGHVIVFGVPGAAITNPPYSAIIQSRDALSIDQKMDDGAPGYGKVMSYTTDASSPTPTCSSNANSYNIASKTITCSLIFLTGF